MHETCHIAIDIGAGSGCKMGVFNLGHQGTVMLAEAFVPSDEYRGTYDEFIQALSMRLLKFKEQFPMLHSGGISSAGILSSSGAFIKLHNLEFLRGKNLPLEFARICGFPWTIDNDANCGALAEWQLEPRELMYWVLGGGWGGAWVSMEGVIHYPCLDWTGNDADLDPSNEPGYATGLKKADIAGILNQFDLGCPANSEGFDQYLSRLDPACNYNMPILGPHGDNRSIRSEVLVSGKGRHLLFAACRSSHPVDSARYDPKDIAALDDPSCSGGAISRLRDQGAHAALICDRIFGTLMGKAGAMVIQDSLGKGFSPAAPIILAGKPVLAFEGFKATLEQEFQRNGIANPVVVSRSLAQAGNPNLVGAAVKARQAYP